MPFIDDDLLWCPDNDGKMVDLSQCLEAAGGQQETGGSPGLGELSQSDLTGLVSGLDEDEDIFKQLGESTFELDNFFNEFEEKEENNNVVSPGGTAAAADSSPIPAKSAALLQEMRSSAARKFNIAAANPLLAEKLAAPSPPAGSGNSNSPANPPVAAATIKVECLVPKGRDSKHVSVALKQTKMCPVYICCKMTAD